MPDLTFETLLLFVFLIVPGVVALQTWNLWCPGPRRDWGNALYEIITYSAIIHVFTIWWVAPLLRQGYTEENRFEIYLAFAVVCIASPAGLATLWYQARLRWLHRWLGLDHPIPRGWEYHLNKNKHFYVLFHLKNGKMLGGYFGGRSYAATFPYEAEIYVEEVIRVNKYGEFVEWVEGSKGAVVRLSDCHRVEFLEVPTEVTHERAGAEVEGGVSGASDSEGAGGEADQTDGQAPGQASVAEGGVGNGPAHAGQKEVASRPEKCHEEEAGEQRFRSGARGADRLDHSGQPEGRTAQPVGQAPVAEGGIGDGSAEGGASHPEQKQVDVRRTRRRQRNGRKT